MPILAIDPGPERSAYVIYDATTKTVVSHDMIANLELLSSLSDDSQKKETCMVIEAIACYGMPVGKEVFDTCIWVGRFIQAWSPGRHKYELVYRREVKDALCHSQRANDSTIRQALLDYFGPGKDRAIGKKANPGPLYGVHGDEWSALAVAITYVTRHEQTSSVIA